ncbi:MAG: hypothetical protein ACREJC_16395 [Tepidisphaeraceae bacterium]
MIAPQDRRQIDRMTVEYPSGMTLVTFAERLTAPVAIAFDTSDGPHRGAVLIAEAGKHDTPPRIYGFDPDGTFFEVFPKRGQFPFGLIGHRSPIRGPLGGMVFAGGRIIFTHRDAQGMGAISSVGYDDEPTTLVADLPAQGDYGVTDLAVRPTDGRIFFGVGSATNSGVVGLDNWAVGWVRKHPEFCDRPYVNYKLLGYRFDTQNPTAGWFSNDIAVTAPFQAFNSSNQTRIPKAANDKPSGAIYSISPGGGDVRVEAHGIRMPRGLAFNELSALFFTNQGMELRGTRPVKDDPDALMRWISGTWYGWPDFSTDLYSIGDGRFQPPIAMIIKTGYPELSFLADHDASGLTSPAAFREQLLKSAFPSLSGAAKFDFVPSSGQFPREMRGNAIVALSGDRAPFASGGQKLVGPVGYKLMRVDPDKRQKYEFITNTGGLPASKLPGGLVALERPVDAKFAPDGSLYILDMGQMSVRDGKEQIKPGSGRLFRLTVTPAATQPTS